MLISTGNSSIQWWKKQIGIAWYFAWEWFILKMLLMKDVPLIKYSDKKIISRKIELIFSLQNWLWKLKMSVTRYQKILLGGSFKCKNLLNFNCTTEKFHNCHHANLTALSVTFWEVAASIHSISKEIKHYFSARILHFMHPISYCTGGRFNHKFC